MMKRSPEEPCEDLCLDLRVDSCLTSNKGLACLMLYESEEEKDFCKLECALVRKEVDANSK